MSNKNKAYQFKQSDHLLTTGLTIDCLHLWWVPLSLDKKQTQETLLLLNQHQYNKYQRRQTTLKQERYLASRYFLYQLLAQYSGIAPEKIKLSYNRFNKPFLDNNSEKITFNFTDTNGYGLFAFSKQTELGVDIEQQSRVGNFARIVEKRFTPNETLYVTEPSGDINQERFLKYWTRKEAYGKALGVGINFKMNQVDLHSEEDTLHISNPDWTLMQLALPNQHVGCLVYEGHQKLNIQAQILNS